MSAFSAFFVASRTFSTVRAIRLRSFPRSRLTSANSLSALASSFFIAGICQGLPAVGCPQLHTLYAADFKLPHYPESGGWRGGLLERPSVRPAVWEDDGRSAAG